MSISPRQLKSPAPSSDLRVAVTFRRPDQGPGPAKVSAPMSLASVSRFLPDPLDMDRGIHELGRLGLRLTRRGNMTASMRCRKDDFERIFGTRLAKVELNPAERYAFYSLYFPPDRAPGSPIAEVSSAVDDCYIQWPHIYMAGPAVKKAKRKAEDEPPSGIRGPSATPPKVSYFHLHNPAAIAKRLNASAVHRKGT